MTRSIRRCPRCLGRDGEHFPECPIPALATITERAETPDAPPQTETLFGDDNELPLPVRSTLHRR